MKNNSQLKTQLEKQLGFQIGTCDGKAWPITGPAYAVRQRQLSALARALGTTVQHGMYVITASSL
jgi:hypothetical protein